MNRLLKPLLAGATLLTLAVPALASAQTYDFHRTDAYADRGDYAGRADFARGDRHERLDRHAGYHSWRYRFARHHHQRWSEDRHDGGWR